LSAEFSPLRSSRSSRGWIGAVGPVHGPTWEISCSESLNGDALDIISRKAAAAQDSLLSPLGLVAVIAGTVLWILIFRVLGPLFDNRETTRAVAIGILVVAVVGTLVNDGGVSIWTTITIAFTVTLAGSWIERISRQHRSLDNRTVSSPRH